MITVRFLKWNKLKLYKKLVNLSLLLILFIISLVFFQILFVVKVKLTRCPRYRLLMRGLILF